MTDYVELRCRADALLAEGKEMSETWQYQAGVRLRAARRAYITAANAGRGTDTVDCYLVAARLYVDADEPKKALCCVAKAVASGDLPGELYLRARLLWGDCRPRSPTRETFAEFVRRVVETPRKPSRKPAPGQAMLFVEEENES